MKDKLKATQNILNKIKNLIEDVRIPKTHLFLI